MGESDKQGDPSSTEVARPRRRTSDIPVLSTVKQVRNAPVGIYRFPDAPGQRLGLRLEVRAAADGSIIRTYRVKYKTRTGRPRHTSIGAAQMTDDGPGVSLKDAMKAAREIKARVALMGDPGAELAEARQTQKALEAGGDGTVEQLAARALKALRLAQSTRKTWEGIYRRELVKGAFGRKLAANVTTDDVTALTDSIIARGAPASANQTFGFLRRVFTWARKKRILKTIPFGVGVAELPAPKKRSHRVLTPQEIRWLVRACRARGGQYEQAVLLLLLTGVRERNVCEVQWAFIEGLGPVAHDEPSWTIPLFFDDGTPAHKNSRLPNAQPHVVPLSRQAAEIILARRACARKGYLFPPIEQGRVRKGGKPSPSMRWHSYKMREIEQAMEDIRAEEYWRATGKRIEDDPNEKPIPDWHVHNLRHTIFTQGRTKLKIPGDVLRLILMHISPTSDPVDAIYNQFEGHDERREALQRWADWIDEISK